MKHLDWFNNALQMKSMWLALNGIRMWNKVLKMKYFRRLSIADWIRKGSYSVKNSFIIWNGFVRVLDWICKSLSWRVGKGSEVTVQVDPVIGVEDTYSLSKPLIN